MNLSKWARAWPEHLLRILRCGIATRKAAGIRRFDGVRKDGRKRKTPPVQDQRRTARSGRKNPRASDRLAATAGAHDSEEAEAHQRDRQATIRNRVTPEHVVTAGLGDVVINIARSGEHGEVDVGQREITAVHGEVGEKARAEIRGGSHVQGKPVIDAAGVLSRVIDRRVRRLGYDLIFDLASDDLQVGAVGVENDGRGIALELDHISPVITAASPGDGVGGGSCEGIRLARGGIDVNKDVADLVDTVARVVVEAAIDGEQVRGGQVERAEVPALRGRGTDFHFVDFVGLTRRVVRGS